MVLGKLFLLSQENVKNQVKNTKLASIVSEKLLKPQQYIVNQWKQNQWNACLGMNWTGV